MSDQVILTKENVLAAYKEGNATTKEDYKRLFKGQVNFEPSWREMTCFEDACLIVGEDPQNQRFWTCDEDDNINRQMKVVMRAYNGNWKPDWSNTSQRKWYIYWEFSGAGFRLAGVRNAYFSYSYVGSRLSFESEEKARHAATKMTSFFNKYLIQ